MKFIYRVIYRRKPLNEEELNKFGSDGWELCGLGSATVELFNGERIVYYFKKSV